MSTAAATDTSITTPWPAGFPAEKPGISGFAVREVAAPADAVFQWLLRPDLHVDYYSALRGVRHVSGDWKPVGKGTTLTFFLGPLFVPPVKVVQADPELRSMAWAAGAPGLKACHAFTVKPLDEGRCLLRSEEKWVGPFARATGLATKGALQKVQTDWAAAIAKAAAQHPAGPPA